MQESKQEVIKIVFQLSVSVSYLLFEEFFLNFAQIFAIYKT